MADVKISALPASTTPLDGTEVLPIVQGTTTKQVSIANVTAGRAVAALSITTATVQATNSGGLALKNSGGTTQISMGSGGGDNLTISVATNITPANAAVAISPTGTGTVTINPATASTMNNVAIGGTAPLAGVFTTVKASTTVGVGAATPSASGAGITFPATQSASSNANTLDDYEEGTWTPAIEGNTGGASTLSVAYGDYTKVGRQVTVRGRIEFSACTLSGGGIYMSGLPFTSNSTTSSYSVGSLLAENIVYIGEIYSFINPNSTNMYFLTGATATGASALAGSAFGSTSKAAFAITYFV